MRALPFRCKTPRSGGLRAPGLRGMQRRLVHLPLPGQGAAVMRQGALTCPDQRSGQVRSAEWLPLLLVPTFILTLSLQRL